MLKFIQGLLNLNVALAAKVRATTGYNEALAYHAAKDYKKALPLMVEAAELGSTQAMSILGSMYLLGQGVKEDGALAVKWLQRAIDGGFDDAASVLGMAYATGKAGVTIDIPKAREMLSFAAERGDEQSSRMLVMMDNGDGIFASLKRGKRR